MESCQIALITVLAENPHRKYILPTVSFVMKGSIIKIDIYLNYFTTLLMVVVKRGIMSIHYSRFNIILILILSSICLFKCFHSDKLSITSCIQLPKVNAYQCTSKIPINILSRPKPKIFPRII